MRDHGSQAIDHCIRQMHALLEEGRKTEARAWVEIAYATAELVARMTSEIDLEEPASRGGIKGQEPGLR
ncbi:hypothetical protein EAH89_30185 [Roseomonas nepalensis]|uniref:Uncharacterized protein n=1 Tax=Muricoccus nepalensis TaxID=1854500 RepID=A0A502EGT3_9PROT|nr:hypothetical protein EAH89_30185 [Roseomonas nepalensis]